MDFGKSFTYMFEDPNWVAKLVIGAAILLVGVLFSWLLAIPAIIAAALLLGYSFAVTRNVAEGNPTPLPEWNDLGALLVRGLTGLVGLIIWELPIIIVACCIGIVNAALGSAASNTTSSSASTALGLVTACLSCILAVLSFVLGLSAYAPMTRFAIGGPLSVFWDYAGNLRFIQANIANYIIALILTIVAGLIGSLGIIACGIGIFLTQFWSTLVSAHLFGQVARTAGGGVYLHPMTVPPGPPPMTPPPAEPTMPA